MRPRPFPSSSPGRGTGLELLGADEAEVVGDSYLELVAPGDRPRVATLLLQMLEGAAESFDFEAAAAGHPRSRFIPAAGPNGRPGRLHGVLHDVERQRRLEPELQQARKLEELGRLAGGVAHDFNNLLTAIAGYGELALAKVPPDSEPLRYDIEQIVAAAGRAAALTRQLLSLGRPQVLQPRVLDLDDVVRGVEGLLARLIGEDIDVDVRCSARRPVNADPGQLERVVVNLALNARDAMPDGGTLTIRTDDVEVDHAFAGRRLDGLWGRYVRLSVADTGVGMDAETRARIFEPFFTSKEPGKGTGLGLATVHGIVAQGGGAIDVDSEPGRGSCFMVYLPAEPAPAVGPGV